MDVIGAGPGSSKPLKPCKTTRSRGVNNDFKTGLLIKLMNDPKCNPHIIKIKYRLSITYFHYIDHFLCYLKKKNQIMCKCFVRFISPL